MRLSITSFWFILFFQFYRLHSLTIYLINIKNEIYINNIFSKSTYGLKFIFHGTVFSMEIINNIVTTCKKKKLSWYFPDTNIWSTWKMDHLIFLFKLHILSYNLIKNLSCVQFYVGYQIKVKLSTWCFTGSKITPYITNQIQIWVAS